MITNIRHADFVEIWAPTPRLSWSGDAPGARMHDVGFKPATPIETGIARFVEWYREFYRP